MAQLELGSLQSGFCGIEVIYGNAFMGKIKETFIVTAVYHYFTHTVRGGILRCTNLIDMEE